MIGVAVAVRQSLDKDLHEILGLGVDADLIILEFGLLGDVLDGVLQSADLVDQAEIQGLLAGEDPPGRQLVDRLLELGAAGSDDVPLEDARRSSFIQSCIFLRSTAVNTASELSSPALAPRRLLSQVMPILFHMSVVANFPPSTPIEAVIVVASAKIVSAAMAT